MSAEELEDLENLPEIQNKRNRRYDIEEEMARLCRGDFHVPTENLSKLYCYLKRDKVSVGGEVEFRMHILCFPSAIPEVGSDQNGDYGEWGDWG